ncbi:MAG TPA: LamG-like jellyroll fold domain-containing protein, partial [Planctomycetota bacterium]|nr:LamG-like jellyroll fold domain-containing protein [Planctomycetota bacterium]
MSGNTWRYHDMRMQVSRPAGMLALLLLFTTLAVPVRGGELENLLGAMRANDARDRVEVNFDDFLSRARAGFDLISPGRSASDPTCLVVAEWSPAVAREVEAYLVHSYAHMLDVLGPGWTERIRETLQAEKARIALVAWDLVDRRPGEAAVIPVESVAIFGIGDRLLHDSIVGHLITGVEEEKPGSPVFSPRGVSSSDSDFLERRRTISNAGGSVEFIWRVSLQSQIKYVPADSNSAFGSFETGSLDLRRGQTTGLFPPGGDPIVYFGTGGKYADNIANTTPFVSRVTLSRDAFGAGDYTIDAAEAGTSYHFSLGVGASGVSVGLAFDSATPLSFASDGNRENVLLLGDRLYFEALPGFKYRGVFRNNGHLTVRNLGIQYREGTQEVGGMSVTLPVQFGYETPVLGVIAGTLDYAIGEEPETLHTTVEYVRPDALKFHQPTFAMVATKVNVNTEEEIEVVVRVKNTSEEFALETGTVRIVESSVNELLEIIDAGGFTRALGTIPARNTANFVFRFRARDGKGLVSPEAMIIGNWQFPVRDPGFEGQAGVSERIRVNLGSGPINNEGGFIRGDLNVDGRIDISDALSALGFLFLGGRAPDCLDSADTNDSGRIDISDATYLLAFLFLGGGAPPAPFPGCGPDPSDDSLECLTFDSCGPGPGGTAELLAHYEMDVKLPTESGRDIYTPNEVDGDVLRAFQLQGSSPKSLPARDRFEPEEEIGALRFMRVSGEDTILTLGPVDYGDSFSLCAWIYFHEGGGTAHIIGQRGFHSMWTPQSRRGMQFRIRSITGAEYEVGGAALIPNNTWHFFAATVAHDGRDTTVKVYRDGALEASRVIEGVRFVNVDNFETTLGAEFGC